MNDYLNVLFSIIAGNLTAAQRDALAALQANWVLLNTRNGRWFVDICGPVAKLQDLRDYLIAQGRDPKVIAIFEHASDGTEIIRDGTSFDWAEYLNVAPDVKTYNAAGVQVSSVRPAVYVETHRFAGWGPKIGAP